MRRLGSLARERVNRRRQERGHSQAVERGRGDGGGHPELVRHVTVVRAGRRRRRREEEGERYRREGLLEVAMARPALVPESPNQAATNASCPVRRPAAATRATRRSPRLSAPAAATPPPPLSSLHLPPRSPARSLCPRPSSAHPPRSSRSPTCRPSRPPPALRYPPSTALQSISSSKLYVLARPLLLPSSLSPGPKKRARVHHSCPLYPLCRRVLPLHAPVLRSRNRQGRGLSNGREIREKWCCCH